MQYELKHQDLVFPLYIVLIGITLGSPVSKYISTDFVRGWVQMEGLGLVLAWWGVNQVCQSALCYFPLLHSTPHPTRWLSITLKASSPVSYVPTHSFASEIHCSLLSYTAVVNKIKFSCIRTGSGLYCYFRLCNQKAATLDTRAKKHIAFFVPKSWRQLRFFFFFFKWAFLLTVAFFVLLPYEAEW